MSSKLQRPIYLLFLSSIAVFFITGCAVNASKQAPEAGTRTTAALTDRVAPGLPKGATIKIAPNSPADTVRAFYKHLRDGRIREAIFLTNLRPAIEGLTDSELKEFKVDFEKVSTRVPAEIEINGEIISRDKATVTAKLPGDEPGQSEIQEIRLRRKGDVWVILTVDESAEKMIRKEGKNYFYALRIKAHHDDARDMLDRVAKAQIAHAAQNQGLYGDMAALVGAGLLPADIQTSESTGYQYAITITPDRKAYAAEARPAVHGKTGRLTFRVELDQRGQPHLTSHDPVKGKGAGSKR